MSAWRREAIRLLPELKKEAIAADEAGMFFIDLRCAFEQAHRATPQDDDFIQRCYDYARWCVEQGDTANHRDASGRLMASSNDLMTMIAVHFWEHLFDQRTIREALPRFVTRDELWGWRDFLIYRNGREGFEKYLQEFVDAPKILRKPRKHKN